MQRIDKEKKGLIILTAIMIIIICLIAILLNVSKKETTITTSVPIASLTANAIATLQITIKEQPTPQGGGGGGGAAQPIIEEKELPEICDLTILLKENMTGTCKDLEQSSSIYFKLDGIAHSIIINKINANNIEIAIYYSLPHKATLAMGQSEEVDLDDDGINDISVRLDSIQEDKATVTVALLMKLEPLVTGVCKCPDCSTWSPCVGGRQARTCYDCGPETDFACKAYEEEQDCVVKAREFPWLWTLFTVLWASLAVLIYLAYVQRKKKKKEIKGKGKIKIKK